MATTYPTGTTSTDTSTMTTVVGILALIAIIALVYFITRGAQSPTPSGLPEKATTEQGSVIPGVQPAPNR